MKQNSISPTILFLVPYPPSRAPSQRFRVELFLPVLQEAGIRYRLEPFLDESTWRILYGKTGAIRKAWGVLKGFLKRFYVVFFVAPNYTHVFIHREASPVGPPLFEWLLTKVLRKRVIYDFDDAIWIPNTSKANSLVSWIKAAWKIKYICSWAHKVVGGNDFLCAFASKYNAEVVCIPTCVDVIKHHNQTKDQRTNKPVIGWTGSHSTLQYLDAIWGILSRIIADFGAKVLIISDKPPKQTLPGLRFVQWSEATEIKDLMAINIGLMPLQPDPWCEGKCGFKLIQYMSLGIPAVASPVGVNTVIVESERNGFLCQTEEEWYNRISELLGDEELRSSFGQKGQEKIQKQYSIQAHAGNFLALFN